MRILGWLVLTIAGLLLAGPTTSAETPEGREKVLEMLKHCGGGHELDEKAPGTPVVLVNLSGCPKMRDGNLVLLKELTHLKRLYLSFTGLTDAGMVHLKDLKSLEKLEIRSTQVTDAGLRHLHGLTNLQRIDISSTKVTDEGVREFRKALPRTLIKR
jgi:hypothetical protein